MNARNQLVSTLFSDRDLQKVRQTSCTVEARHHLFAHIVLVLGRLHQCHTGQMYVHTPDNIVLYVFLQHISPASKSKPTSKQILDLETISPIKTSTVHFIVKISFRKSFTIDSCGVVRPSVCVCVRPRRLLLGTPRASKFGTCEPWYVILKFFQKNFKKVKNWIFGEFF